MSPPNPDPGVFKDALDKLALILTDQAGTTEVAFAEKVDAFKVLSGYYLGLTKANPTKPKEPPDPKTGFRDQMNAAGEDLA